MHYVFVLKTTEVEVLIRQPFPNLFIGVDTETDEEVGYEMVGDTIVVKYLRESTEAKCMIRSTLTMKENGYRGQLPDILGKVALSSGVRRMKFGKTILTLQVFLNHDDEGYVYTQGKAVGEVNVHFKEGLVFRLDGGRTYTALLPYLIIAIRDTYVTKGMADFIPDEYEVRISKSRGFEYYPLASVFRDPTKYSSINHKLIPEQARLELQAAILGLE